jgi:hypothetical protein
MKNSSTTGSSTPRRIRRPQVSLSTLLLLIATLAVWFGYWNASRQTQRLRRNMSGLLSISRELDVKDPTQAAAVARVPEWLGESIWDIYLPKDGLYEVCLAFDQIDAEGLVTPLQRVRINPGYRTVELKYETETEESIASVLVDGKVVIEETRPKDWEPRRGSTGASVIYQSEQFDPTRPLVLYRKRFRSPDGASPPKVGPTQGILVWIEPAER